MGWEVSALYTFECVGQTRTKTASAYGWGDIADTVLQATDGRMEVGERWKLVSIDGEPVVNGKSYCLQVLEIEPS
jgi:hypothetical protein